MNEKHIAKLEARLEKLVEGAFTNLFRKRVSAHDLAMQVARSMENALRFMPDADKRPLAPDAYTIVMHPSIAKQLEPTLPQLKTTLSSHIVDLVMQSGYRLAAEPVVDFVSDDDLDVADVQVHAKHTVDADASTQKMQPIPAKQTKVPRKPQLIINNGTRVITLTEPLLNIGRSADNHLVLDDSYCSRHHVQLRLRFGTYTLFDVNSRGGTLVNNVPVTEHQLQSGDVITIGSTNITYVVEGGTHHTTQTLEPVE
ncbi:MAG: FhaA domain-containing protein [Chloroflexota bacterium]